MTEGEAIRFVEAFTAAWRTRDPAAFETLWHADGVLRWPFTDRTIAGAEIGRLNGFVATHAPDLVWTLIGWTWRDDVVVIEWENRREVAGTQVSWRGVDKFTLREGRIAEERVYADTAPLRAAYSGEPPAQLIPF
jgi:ketosteroid isomerase-like protein